MQNIKQSLILQANARLPGSSGYPDLPPGEHDRPCHYLLFVKRTESATRRFGTVFYDYLFDFICEVKKDEERPSGYTETDQQELARAITAAFVVNEHVPYYAFSGAVDKYGMQATRVLREGLMRVTKFTISENSKDRQRDQIRGELVITF